ncbi:hypothetical protein Q8A73_000787 [Channa argus]|nr:hypothetical protein Q8A73_000787 [Channa argus]
MTEQSDHQMDKAISKQEITSLTKVIQHPERNDRILGAISERLQRLHLLNPIASEPRLPPPERFSGRAEECRPFLLQCSLVFELQPSSFPTERAKVAYILCLLTGRARQWATAEWDRASNICSSAKLFAEELCKVFDHPATAREVARKLLQLTQGGSSVADYSIQFKILAAKTQWNPEALYEAYYHGLADYIKDILATRELPKSLDDLVSLTIKIDQRLWQRCRERKAASRAAHLCGKTPCLPVQPTLAPSQLSMDVRDDEPMHLEREKLTAEEKKWPLKTEIPPSVPDIANKGLAGQLKTAQLL